MVDFITSIALVIYHWWKHHNSRFQIFLKNCIVSIGFAWVFSTAIASLSGLVLGCMLAFNLYSPEEITAMNNTILIVVFWSFVGILGLGVYLGIRAILMDVLRKTQSGYRDTFGAKLSIEDRLGKVETDIAIIKKKLEDKSNDL